MIRSPYRHEKHAERYIRTLKTIARSILINTGRSEQELSKDNFWTEQSLVQAARLYNMLPNSRCPEGPRTLAMNMEARQRDNNFVFGQTGWTKRHDVTDDITARAERAIFIGCPEDALGYLLYLPDTKVIRARHDFIPNNKNNSILAIRDFPDAVSFNEEKRKAIEKECSSFLEKEVFEFVPPETVDHSKLVHCFMFVLVDDFS